MSTAILFLVAFNVILALLIGILWIRSMRPPKEDPRLSRGLQLLQSKIAVLEDLSDRTDRQVAQLVAILEERTKYLQGRIYTANEMLGKIDKSMNETLEAAEVFQNDMPHEELLERQATQKYVTAAKMAHEGRTVNEIAQKVNLPRSEIEFIAKVNKDQLMFEPDALPIWAKPSQKERLEHKTIDRVFANKSPDLASLDEVSKNFKEAVRDHEFEEQKIIAQQKARREKQLEAMDNAREFANDVLKAAGQAIDTTTAVAGKALDGTSAAAGRAIREARKAAQPKLGLYTQRAQNETNDPKSEIE